MTKTKTKTMTGKIRYKISPLVSSSQFLKNLDFTYYVFSPNRVVKFKDH